MIAAKRFKLSEYTKTLPRCRELFRPDQKCFRSPLCRTIVLLTGRKPTLIPALRHLDTASGTVERGGSIMDKSPTKHRLEVGKFMESVSKG